VLGAYRPLLADPAARRLVAASLTGRLSIGVLDLPLVVAVERVSGSYAVAGAAVGAHAAGLALSAPLRGRLLDRRGTSAGMPPLVAVNVAALAALPLAAGAGSAVAMLVLAALAGASSPSFAAAMRVEWQRLLAGRDGPPLLERAYAFETSAQVSVFIAGGLVAALGLATVGARGTLLACAVLTAAGGAAFAALARAPGTPRRAGAPRRSPIAVPGVRTLVLATALADVGLGAIDVAVIAFADERGDAAVAGLLLALFAASAAASAIASGARAWRAPPPRRLVVVLAVLAAAVAALSLAASLAALAVLLAVAGAPSAAQWTTVSVALDAVAPPGAGAEAYNWLSTANATGFALGGLAAGVAVEAGGPATAFLAAASCIALAAGVVAARRTTLT